MSNAVLTLIVLAIAVVFFVFEVFPAGITALTACTSLYLLGILDIKQVYASFSDPIVILTGCMLIVANSLFETGIAATIGNLFVKMLGKTEGNIMAGMMLLSAFLSVFLSNVSVVALLIPITIGVAETAGISRSRLLMPMSFAAAFGGLVSMIGTPTNNMVAGFLTTAGYEGLEFFSFAWVGVPITILGTLYMLTIGRKLLPQDTHEPQGEQNTMAKSLPSQTVEPKPLNKAKAVIASVVFCMTIIGLCFYKRTGIPMVVVGMIASLILVLTGVMSDKTAYRYVSWDTVFLMAGMFSVATALTETGAGKMIATFILGLMGHNPSPYVIICTVYLLNSALTQFIGNTAVVAFMGPIALVMAEQMGCDPRAMMLTVTLGASLAIASPIGTPSSTIIYGPGNYRFMDYVKVGGPAVLLGLLVTLLILPVVFPFYP